MLTTMKSWCLSNFSVQIAPDCIREYLNFQNFTGSMPTVPPSFSCRRHSSLALSRQYCTYSQLCPTKEKFPAPPLTFTLSARKRKNTNRNQTNRKIQKKKYTEAYFFQKANMAFYLARLAGLGSRKVLW